MKRIISVVALLAISVFFLGAQEKAFDPLVVGQWASNGVLVYVFNADGTGTMVADEGNKRFLDFTWFTAEGKLTVLVLYMTQNNAYTSDGEKLSIYCGAKPYVLSKTVQALDYKDPVLVGRWESADAGYFLFIQDGSVEYLDLPSDSTVRYGRYETSGNTVYLYEAPYLLTRTFSVEGGTLSLDTWARGKKTTKQYFKR